MEERLVLREVKKQLAPQPPADAQAVIIAVDLARSKWVYSCRWSGQEQRRLSTPGTLGHLQALVREYHPRCRVRVIYEACGFGYEIAWWLEEQGMEVHVVSPSTVERAPGTQVKTDRCDARHLGLKSARDLLKAIYIPRRDQHQLRQLSRTYGQAVADRKRQQKRVRMLLQEHGRIGPHPSAGWTAYRSWLDQQPLAASVALCVRELRQLREQADASVQRLRRALAEAARLPQYRPVVQALAGQSGVGPFTAIRFVLEIGDIRRFPSADSISHFLGLTPSEYSSGEMVHRGHLRKCGPGYLRAWMIQCAWACIRAGKDPKLTAFFERLAQRAGKKRAIVAVARKLAVRLRARWLGVLETLAPAA